DGNNPEQLTHGTGEIQPSFSPDGRWVVYTSGGPENDAEKRTVWRISVDGGEPVRLTTSPSNWPNISPDGRFIACQYKPDPTSAWKIAVIPFEGGQPVKLFDVVPASPLRWMPDGTAIAYINTRGDISNIWSQPVDGGLPRQLTRFTSEKIE